MSELDELADVLPANLRSVWPHVADCANRVGGVLMGGTAVAIHLRHRVSEDLDVITLEKFSGKAQERRLRKSAAVVDVEEVSDNMFHGFVDGVRVDIFRALPTDEVHPSDMRWVGSSTEIAGMNVGSIPDLMAAKLDVIMRRPKLRGYLDLAAMDESGACSLEAGLGYYCQRFGYSHPPHALEEITRLLDNPGTLPTDPDYEDRRSDALEHLQGRVPDLRVRIAEMRDIAVNDSVSASAQRIREAPH
ncbi:nucleotidyl transferase AbiEii/AbiGii toxin family protein [Candidatus Poriferisodalis sp.]|uniref:nucleotidyl transferase AbiEii/AbiGii toxin family protein n=1 Tax=Candidatus Poriferisodalis sp. TaxID=3101277 RepID=UPI003B01F34F